METLHYRQGSKVHTVLLMVHKHIFCPFEAAAQAVKTQYFIFVANLLVNIYLLIYPTDTEQH